MNKSVITTRLAPSPTSTKTPESKNQECAFVHLGNIRTLLYNYFLAKKLGGKFLVRLEDTDRDRYDGSFLPHFQETLEWLGITPDYSYWNPDPSVGSFIQSERDYSQKIQYLLDNDMAYYSFDTPQEGDALREKGLKYDYTTRLSMRNSLTLSKDEVNNLLNSGNHYVIRFKTPENVDVTFTDAILGEITINTATLDDKVLLKSNGIGSYHLCNVCDDHDMGVTHVLRGQEWINSTPMHVLLYQAFGWDIPTFAHLPLIMNPDGKGKLSKRTSAKYGIPISAIGYKDANGNYQKGWREAGFEPQVLINALSLIGWNPGDERDILTMDELIESFSLEHVSKSGARFDIDKAKWINSQWIQHRFSNKELFGDKFDHLSDEQKDILFTEVKKRCHFRHDIQTELDKIFVRGKMLDISDDEIKLLGKLQNQLFINNWSSKTELENILIDFMSINELKNNFLGFLRKTILFGVQGVDVKSCIFILGKNEIVDRLSSYVISKEVFELQ